MMSKKILIILFLILCTIPIKTYSQSFSKAGFIPGNIWYSPDPFEEKDIIKIHTIVFNPEDKQFLGDVIFFDNDVFLDKKSFSVQAKEIKEVEISWTVTAGKHKIFAKIENAKLLLPNGKFEEIYIAQNKTEENIREVEKKIILKTINLDPYSIIDNISINSSESIQNIKNTIKENTPSFIVEPATLTANVIETIRSDISNISKVKKETIQNEIKAINITNQKNNTEKENKFIKPLKYLELFFFTLLSYIFNIKFIFYGILFIIIIFILRYFWRLIF